MIKKNIFGVDLNRVIFFKKLIPIFILIFYVTDDTFMFGTMADNNIVFVKVATYIVFLIALFRSFDFRLNLRAVDKKFSTLVILIGSIFITSFANFDFSGGFVYFALIITLAYLVSKKIIFSDFVKYYQLILILLSIVSILLFFIPNILLSLLPRQENIAGVSFANTYFGAIMIGTGAHRSSSIFREPGVFSVYLILGFIFEFFVCKKPRLIYLTVFLISLITTFSTTGYLLFLFLLFARIVNYKIDLVKTFFIIIIGCIAYVFLIGGFGFDLVTAKLSSENNSYGSTLARIASIEVNLKIFLESPIFGVGINKFPYLYQSFSNLLYGFPLSSTTSTNTFMSLLAYFGLLPFFIAFYSLKIFSFAIANSFLSKIIILIALLLAFSSQDMRYSILFNCLIFYFFGSLRKFKHEDVRYQSQG